MLGDIPICFGLVYGVSSASRQFFRSPAIRLTADLDNLGHSLYDTDCLRGFRRRGPHKTWRD